MIFGFNNSKSIGITDGDLVKPDREGGIFSNTWQDTVNDGLAIKWRPTYKFQGTSYMKFESHGFKYKHY